MCVVKYYLSVVSTGKGYFLNSTKQKACEKLFCLASLSFFKVAQKTVPMYTKLWFQVISDDFKWFQMISNDFRRFRVISNDFKWFRMISCDFTWFQVISDDFRWFQMISVISNDFKWFRVISSDFKLISTSEISLFPLALDWIISRLTFRYV